MAIKRVIAYFMHEHEAAAAQQAMQQIDGGTDSYVMGEMDDSQFDAVRASGVILQEVPDAPPQVETPGFAGAGLARMAVDVPHLDLALAVDNDADFNLTGPNYYVIQLTGPLLPNWKNDMEAMGVQLLQRLPGEAYTAELTVQQLPEIRARTDMVRSVRLYGTSDSGRIGPHPESTGLTAAGDPTAPRQMLPYDARLHRAEDRDSLVQWLNDNGVPISGTGRKKVRVFLLDGSPQFDEIRRRFEVADLEPYVPPEVSNDVARQLIGIDTTAGVTQIAETGAGQVVGIADTGVDDTHPDLAAQLMGFADRGRPGMHDDPDGHGTHVAGSVSGNGPVIKGTAPGAKIYFQSLLDSSGKLGGLPVDLGDLFLEAYNQGARIHNNSWGSKTGSTYPSSAEEVDQFVAEHRDMLIVIAAGNEGTSASPRNAAPGFCDWLSINSPASAKNALTVGASRSSRTAGGYSTLTYNQAWGQKFPMAPIGTELVSGDPMALAGFSGRGPLLDFSIKPDLVAPGTDIVSTRSSIAPIKNYWGAYKTAGYAYNGGTSMAAPIVSGCAALVREFYLHQGHLPSAALLKATLINSTIWLTGADAIAPQLGRPNFHQGHGCIYMPNAIPNQANPAMILAFVDDWQQPATEHLRNVPGSSRKRYVVDVQAGTPLRICMAYTDEPARALQNDISLSVQLPSNLKMLGNENVPKPFVAPFDTFNNVECVRIDDPAAGNYLIQVAVQTLKSDSQDFALVVTGDLNSPLTEI